MGIRVIKTAVAAVLAIYMAASIGLNNAISAGLLAVLGVDVTIKRSLLTVAQRLLASLCGLLLAVVLFWLFGFDYWVVGVFVLIAYPILSRIGLRDGIITCTVVVLHLFASRSTDLGLIVNEVMLLVVGLGTAMVVNAVYMPREEGRLASYRSELEEQLSRIFKHMGAHLRRPDTIWDGSELLRAHELIAEGEKLALRVLENRLFHADSYWKNYFRMRGRQLARIEQMLELIALVDQALPQGENVAELFEELSKDVKSFYYTGNVEKRLDAVEREFREMELPRTRQEFEIRAALLGLCRELRAYLERAKREKRKRP
ncbi:aromatic acid exporter family protein [Paenibacillus thermoaerophilus]|uniref:Aromatic acid exporter family protein n=1 Tax=Paenibacillus thermoaerophilus TaxID=1215385 RepID=A0ABW2V5Y4_9BACL|nr:aromatic acid exporter family protein [Paenibacillus thermoaerophilus]TMV17108.1 aromatic acid exporter family protein [Paenibacillus thermoaerophilus]